MTVSALLNLIDRFGDARILVVGDMMLDRFIWGKVSRISPEAPVPVVQVVRESAILGGAANVVCNIQALGGQAVPVGMIGKDAPAAMFKGLLSEQNIADHGLVASEDFATIQKTRIVAHQQQVCRVDREGTFNLSTDAKHLLESRLQQLLPEASALIISDYGKGVIYPSMLKQLREQMAETYISVDPKDKNFAHYQGVDILTPNHNEAERMADEAIVDRPSLRRAAQKIFQQLHCRHLLITLGEHGMALFTDPENLIRIPTKAREVYDVSGAGDTVIATYTLAKAVGSSPAQAAWLANLAAGIVVGKLGTATVTSEELKAAVEESGDVPQGQQDKY